MSLREQITADMKEAMRARDTTRLEAARLLRAAIQRREIDKQIELTDDEVLSVIQKMIKQGHDSIEQFEKGDRAVQTGAGARARTQPTSSVAQSNPRPASDWWRLVALTCGNRSMATAIF